MQGEDLSEYCSAGATYLDERLAISSQVTLRLITFTPPQERASLPVVFVAGWISLIEGWKEVLREMTKDFTVYYVETREKISSEMEGMAGYGVEDIAGDLKHLMDQLDLASGRYILCGSSLGATAILECYRSLTRKPRCLVLIAPNAAFRVPFFWKPVVALFYPGFYALIRPTVKWYLRRFRLNVNADRAQYEKYCHALDAADPWKLKEAVMTVWSYEVWSILKTVDCPTLIVNASKDKLHEPESMKRMVAAIPRGMEIDLETNARTHSRDVVQAIRSYIAQLANVVPAAHEIPYSSSQASSR
jgi:pimeloyl-ACP methyl ester carboxylesterase